MPKRPHFWILQSAVFFTGLLYTGSLFAAPNSSSSIRVKATRKAKVRVFTEISRKHLQNLRRLDILRADPKKKIFKVISRIGSPKRSQLTVDDPYQDGLYRYRACLYLQSGKTICSRIRKVRLQPSMITPPRTALREGQEACPSGYVRSILNLVNQARAGSDPLKLHDQLQWAARTHTIDMADKQNFSHDGWGTFIRNSGFRGSSMGENIAFGYTSPDYVMNGWLNSPGHRANILNTRYLYIGIGCVIGRDGRYWWTQNFGG